MSKPARPAIVRFYVDADVLGLAKELVRIRGDVTYPGDPGGPVKVGDPAPRRSRSQITPGDRAARRAARAIRRSARVRSVDAQRSWSCITGDSAHLT